MCDIDGTDPFTMEGRLCDEDGWVRRGSMHHGTDYLCTGHAHPAEGGHIRCTNPTHYRPATTASFTHKVWLEPLQATGCPPCSPWPMAAIHWWSTGGNYAGTAR